MYTEKLDNVRRVLESRFLGLSIEVTCNPVYEYGTLVYYLIACSAQPIDDSNEPMITISWKVDEMSNDNVEVFESMCFGCFDLLWEYQADSLNESN